MFARFKRTKNQESKFAMQREWKHTNSNISTALITDSTRFFAL